MNKQCHLDLDVAYCIDLDIPNMLKSWHWYTDQIIKLIKVGAYTKKIRQNSENIFFFFFFYKNCSLSKYEKS